jgi:sec-independent protein translocase protein TatA
MIEIALPPLAFIPFVGGLSPAEMLIIGAVAVLLFGSKLPEVGKSLGKSLMEFKKGMQGIEDEIRSASSKPSGSKRNYYELDDREEPTAPKFEPPATT